MALPIDQMPIGEGRHPNGEPGEPTLPRYGFVFVAFARPGIGGYVVFDWEWREEDPDAPGRPLNGQSDFTRRTWPTT